MILKRAKVFGHKNDALAANALNLTNSTLFLH